MNIIELFEKLNIDKGKTLQFTPEEIIRIEKQVNVEKRINPEIDVNVAANLIEALRNYPNEFHFLTSNRILYNFFAKTSYFRDYFIKDVVPENKERVKLFIGAFLEEELMLFFDQKLSKNGFEEMNDLLTFKDYFPEDILFKLNKKAVGKIDFSLSILALSSSDLSKILYIKHRSFYEFLSHFSSIEVDEKLKMVLNRIVDIYNINKQSEFGGTTMISMSFYKAFDEDFEDTLKRNRDVVYSNQDSNSSSSSGSWFSGVSWRTFGIILFILLRVGFAASKCSSDHSSGNYNNNTNYDNVVYDKNSFDKERMQQGLMSIYQTQKFEHFEYLASYNDKATNDIKLIENIKTGDNVFEGLFGGVKNYVENNEKMVSVNNNSNSDLIILCCEIENGVEIPRYSYFVKKGETFKINAANVYNFYFGTKLASFKTEYETEKKRFSDKDYEYRFLTLPKNCYDILKDTYQFKNDVTISEKAGKIKIDSKESVFSSPQKVTNGSTNEVIDDAPIKEKVTEEPPKAKEIIDKN